MENKILDVDKRVRRYWYSDGIVELVIGGLFLLLGIFLSLMGYLGEDSTAGTALAVIMVLAMMGGVFGMQRLINALKARFTYPRTGYVEYRAGDKEASQRRNFISTIILAGMVLLILIFSPLPEVDSTVLASGLIMGVVFVALRAKSSGGLIRFYILGGLSILLGVGLSLSGLSRSYGLGLFFDLIGVTMMVTGGFVLQNYVRDNPITVDTDGEDE